MLSVLSSIGIDFKMLAVQIVNFLILLFILKKFVYHPIIEKIEKDEKELDKAKRETAKIEREKDEVYKEQKQAIAKTKKRAEEIIAEAEMIAESLKEETKLEMRRRIKNQEVRLENLQKSQKLTWENEWKKERERKINTNVLRIFESLKNESIEKAYLEIQFNSLVEKLNEVVNQDLKEISKLIEMKVEDSPDQFEDNSEQESVIEYSHSLTPSQEKRLREIVSQSDLELILKHNSDLIYGFRIDLLGKVIESNLKQEVYHAINL